MPQRLRSSQTLSPLIAAAGRDKAFLIEDLRDLPIHLASGVELRDSPPQSIQIDMVAVSVNPPRQAMFARRAGLPNDLEPDLAMRTFLVVNHFTHDEAQNALSIGGRGRLASEFLRFQIGPHSRCAMVCAADRFETSGIARNK